VSDEDADDRGGGGGGVKVGAGGDLCIGIDEEAFRSN